DGHVTGVQTCALPISIRSALDGEVIAVGIFLIDQILGCANKIIENILLFVAHAGTVPVFAELGATAQVRHRINSAMLQPYIRTAAEGWRHADVESAIAG